MIERCYVMVKPGFAKEEIIKKTIEILESREVRLIDSSYIKYDEDTARLHYIEKSGKPYVKELIDYISSDVAFGMVFEGENALNICRNTVEELRTTLAKMFNLKTDIMRNILHCSSKTKVGDTYLELDTQRELALFNYLKNKNNQS